MDLILQIQQLLYKQGFANINDAGLIRDNDIIIPDKNSIIEIGDQVIFIAMSNEITKAEEIFQVRESF